MQDLVGTEAPATGDTWIALSERPLPVADAQAWVVRPDCGATVCFTGTVRDHSEGRPAVERLIYEAYEDQVAARFAAIAAEVRRRWPDVGRVALLHRTGELVVSDTAVVVAVGAPHRQHAFEAGRWAIDELKASAPIWKKECWAGGEAWAPGCDQAGAEP